MLFFERMKTKRGEWPTTFRRDVFPISVRIQCFRAWEKVIGDSNLREQSKKIVNVLCDKIGVHELNNKRFASGNYVLIYEKELNYFLENGMPDASKELNIEYAFSALELMCKSLNNVYLSKATKVLTFERINNFLRLGGVGYKFIKDQLIEVEDDDLTETCLEPVIGILNSSKRFCQANDYLRKAYEGIKTKDLTKLENVVENGQKAVESLLKSIFDDLSIDYDKKTYNGLVELAREKGILFSISNDKIDPLLDARVSNSLKSLGDIRNKDAGHGKVKSTINERVARLALHHATANMLYIAETYLDMKENE